LTDRQLIEGQIIAPGSQTTLAQLGLPESFTPARHRFASRMFPAQEAGHYESVRYRKKEKKAQPTAQEDPSETNGEAKTEEEEDEWEEDLTNEEGAIWPIQKGSIVDWPCFYALIEHVYQSTQPLWHTPILIISDPVWTHKECEKVSQFIFEKFKTPALAMMDAAVAASYAYGVPTATVVDVGFEKANVSCIADFVLQDVGRALAVPDCGGETMTQRLFTLLKDKEGFTYSVCEQLKKSPICEVLPSDAELPSAEAPGAEPSNPAAAASTGIDPAGPRKQSLVGDVPRGPGPGTEVGEEKKPEEEEGVLDIASIVTSGNLNTILAQKEREKAEKAAAKQKKIDDKNAAANKPARLVNSKRARNTFIYEELKPRESTANGTIAEPTATAPQPPAVDGQPASAPEPQSATSEQPPANGVSAPSEGTAESLPTSIISRREIEVGLERFQAASDGLLDRLADAIYNTIQSCNETARRSDLWDSLIVLGNGSKVRGFKEALQHTLQTKYIISPSSATIFTSEIPSSLSTPAATGANTPQLGPNQYPLGGPPSNVNPLLHAALTARSQDPSQMFPPGTPGSMPQTPFQPGQQGIPPSPYAPAPTHHNLHHSAHHQQTPTAIRFAKIPEYFPEWKDVGYDEATFLGAQVAGKLLFIVDGGASKGYLTRSDYNEQGPGGIHDVRL
jgi:actin-related protein 9